MERFKRQAILLKLLTSMKEHGSWCGETHLQKCAYFLEEGLRVPLELQFVLYKHGPFSFDLREVLGEMRSNFLINVDTHPPFGPSLVVSEYGQNLVSRFPRATRRYTDQIEFVADHLARKPVVELERLATALYVRTKYPQLAPDAQAEEIHSLKPHIPIDRSQVAVRDVEALLSQAPLRS